MLSLKVETISLYQAKASAAGSGEMARDRLDLESTGHMFRK
jgi:hypothetical protein